MRFPYKLQYGTLPITYDRKMEKKVDRGGVLVHYKHPYLKSLIAFRMNLSLPKWKHMVSKWMH